MDKLFGIVRKIFRETVGMDEIEEAERILRHPMGWHREDFDRDVAAIADDNPHLDDITLSLEIVYLNLNIFMPIKRAESFKDVGNAYIDFRNELHILRERYDYPQENINRLVKASRPYVNLKTMRSTDYICSVNGLK